MAFKHFQDLNIFCTWSNVTIRDNTDQEGVTWVALITHHSRHHNRVWIKTGGRPVMTRLLGILGIRAVYIDTEHWEKLESDSDREKFLRDLLAI